MTRPSLRFSVALLAGLSALGFLSTSAQAEEGTPFDIGSKYSLTAPADWVKKEPRSRIVEYEFEIPKAEGDEIPGRVTVMGAGGGVEANVARWEGQFAAGEGEAPKAKTTKLKAADQDVYLIEIKGTYNDKPAPMAPGPGIPRENYVMLGAIIVTDGGQYFVKSYGPAKTMEKAMPGFQKMVEGLKAK